MARKKSLNHSKNNTKPFLKKCGAFLMTICLCVLSALSLVACNEVRGDLWIGFLSMNGFAQDIWRTQYYSIADHIVNFFAEKFGANGIFNYRGLLGVNNSSKYVKDLLHNSNIAHFTFQYDTPCLVIADAYNIPLGSTSHVLDEKAVGKNYMVSNFIDFSSNIKTCKKKLVDLQTNQVLEIGSQVPINKIYNVEGQSTYIFIGTSVGGYANDMKGMSLATETDMNIFIRCLFGMWVGDNGARRDRFLMDDADVTFYPMDVQSSVEPTTWYKLGRKSWNYNLRIDSPNGLEAMPFYDENASKPSDTNTTSDTYSRIYRAVYRSKIILDVGKALLEGVDGYSGMPKEIVQDYNMGSTYAAMKKNSIFQCKGNTSNVKIGIMEIDPFNPYKEEAYFTNYVVNHRGPSGNGTVDGYYIEDFVPFIPRVVDEVINNAVGQFVRTGEIKKQLLSYLQGLYPAKPNIVSQNISIKQHSTNLVKGNPNNETYHNEVPEEIFDAVGSLEQYTDYKFKIKWISYKEILQGKTIDGNDSENQDESQDTGNETGSKKIVYKGKLCSIIIKSVGGFSDINAVMFDYNCGGEWDNNERQKRFSENYNFILRYSNARDGKIVKYMEKPLNNRDVSKKDIAKGSFMYVRDNGAIRIEESNEKNFLTAQKQFVVPCEKNLNIRGIGGYYFGFGNKKEKLGEEEFIEIVMSPNSYSNVQKIYITDLTL